MNPAHATRKRLADIAPTRWKNGKGVTRELLSVPARDNPDDFVLRVSVADVDADGAFSIYPGIDRILAILRGAGMDLLDIPANTVWRTLAGRSSSVAFAGERPLACRLLDGPVLDFNVMVRRDAGAAELRIVGRARVVPAPTCRLLFVAQGSARIAFEDGNAIVLEESHFIEPLGATSVATGSDSVALLVDFRPLE
ncbi:HutD family protein [Caballeronia sp. INDeC2]|uniref:HutD/Ves family protein n=1 Tax=Caballeronia sp. INDeC2 TaxID=2921747 RepID=UPI0020298318|nr:HutD family protein [Caballeronia sp. INDeC2]